MRPEVATRRWMLAPALLLFAAVAVLPIAELVAMSLARIDWIQGKANWQYVGLSQYARVFGDPLFRAGAFNTLLFAAGAVLAQMVLGFALALMTTRITRGRVLYRTVFLLPILVPGIVIGAIWKLMYNFDFGVLNQMLGVFGLAPVDWLGNGATALLAVIVVDVWHWTPFVFLLMLAGLESLPTDVYEAARVDGATFWQELRHVTLPLMLPAIVVTLVFRLIVSVKVFDEIYLLTGGGPGTATEVVSYTIFRRFFTEGQTGYGSAMSVVVLFALALAFILARAVTRRREATT
ncbi:MAG: sugar ABC transporter permease [Betaproteobacteria bacterium]|nr:sugar ABC transporter permease [Betaproteobacteria bacterium]